MAWHVLHLKPRTEKRVAQICRRLGLPHYLPLRQSLRIYPKRRVIFDLPLFPGYIFVNFTEGTGPASIQGNYIVRILTPSHPFQLLRQLVQVRRLLRLDPELQTIDPLEPGDPIRIKSGPFAGFTGTVKRIKNRPTHRLLMLNIELVGQTVAAEIEAHLVEKY